MHVSNIITSLLLFTFSGTLMNAGAVELLSKEQAVKRMFITADATSEEVKKLTTAQVDEVKSLIGGTLYAIKKPATASDDEYTFIFGSKEGKKTGVAIIEEQEDKWGPLSFIIVLDPVTGKVINAAMLKYVDGRARNLANRAYLKEFFDKGLTDPITVGKDISAVSGATVSCDILCFIVKKVMAVYKVSYLK